MSDETSNEHFQGLLSVSPIDPLHIIAEDDHEIPWSVARISVDLGGSGLEDSSQSIPTAKRMVKCYNEFDGLCNALRSTLLILDALHPDGTFHAGGSILTIIERAKDTLQKAENNEHNLGASNYEIN